MTKRAFSAIALAILAAIIFGLWWANGRPDTLFATGLISGLAIANIIEAAASKTKED